MKIDFLICSERSGSNLITKLLDNHSEYCGPSPAHLIRTFVPVIDRYGELYIDNNWKKLITDIVDFFNCKIGIWEIEISFSELVQIEDRKLEAIISYLYLKEAQKQNKKKVFLKEIQIYNHFSYINEVFKSPKYIWLVRDPRDMALSWINSPVHRGDVIRATDIWVKDQANAFEAYDWLSAKNSILLVKYENLISNQKEVLNEVCTFLNIPFENEMLNINKNKLSTKNAKQTDSWKNLEKNIIKNNYKKYKNNLTEEQIRYIEFKSQPLMNKLGYSLDFPILEKYQFKRIEFDLKKSERYNKPEYQNIDELEKIKRKKWHRKFEEIQSNL